MSIQEIEALSNAEKFLLIEQLWNSIDKQQLPVSEAQQQELDRRLERYASGQTRFYTWDEVKQRLRTELTSA